MILQWDESMDFGSDTGTPVDDQDYQCPFTFTGKFNKITIKVDRPNCRPRTLRNSRMRKRKRSMAHRCTVCKAGPH